MSKGFAAAEAGVSSDTPVLSVTDLYAFDACPCLGRLRGASKEEQADDVAWGVYSLPRLHYVSALDSAVLSFISKTLHTGDVLCLQARRATNNGPVGPELHPAFTRTRHEGYQRGRSCTLPRT